MGPQLSSSLLQAGTDLQVSSELDQEILILGRILKETKAR